MPDPERKLYLRLTGTRIVQLRPRRGGPAVPTSFPTYEVTLGTRSTRKVLGTVARELVTRERRVPGRRYVEARWSSPGWTSNPRDGRRSEHESRGDAIMALVEQAGSVPYPASRTLAEAVRHDRG